MVLCFENVCGAVNICALLVLIFARTPSEALLIKCFDSKKDKAKLSPHTAFQCEFDAGPPRQSIEVRCLVFWESDTVE